MCRFLFLKLLPFVCCDFEQALICVLHWMSIFNHRVRHVFICSNLSSVLPSFATWWPILVRSLQMKRLMRWSERQTLMETDKSITKVNFSWQNKTKSLHFPFRALFKMDISLQRFLSTLTKTQVCYTIIILKATSMRDILGPL